MSSGAAFQECAFEHTAPMSLVPQIKLETASSHYPGVKHQPVSEGKASGGQRHILGWILGFLGFHFMFFSS